MQRLSSWYCTFCWSSFWPLASGNRNMPKPTVQSFHALSVFGVCLLHQSQSFKHVSGNCPFQSVPAARYLLTLSNSASVSSRHAPNGKAGSSCSGPMETRRKYMTLLPTASNMRFT